MIILGIFTDHDAGAALFEDYRMIAAVALERMTRIKCDGNRFPEEAVEECLAAAGLSRSDVDVLAMPRLDYPADYFRGHAWWDMFRPGDRRSVLRQTIYQRDPQQRFFDDRQYLQHHGFAPTSRLVFYNHHLAHALTALFHTDWQDGVLYTADGGGDRIFYSARELHAGSLREVFGSAADSLSFRRTQFASGSLAQLYAATTKALGFVPLRHEGKVLGLAAFGKPRFADMVLRAYRVDEAGRIDGSTSRRRLRREPGSLR